MHPNQELQKKLFKTVMNECLVRHNMRSEIKTIKRRISHLRAVFQTFGRTSLLEGEDLSGIANRRRFPVDQIYSYVVADQEVIGLEGDIEYLVQHLVNDKNGDNCYRVISICGMGGLGKTTLAGKIYNHPIIVRHFDCLSSVCISQQWQTNDILQKILLKLSPERRNEDLSLRDDDELVKQIFDILLGKRYLVVLDDIWSTDVIAQASNRLHYSSLVIAHADSIAESTKGEILLRQLWGPCNLQKLEIAGPICKLLPAANDNVSLSSNLTTLLLSCSCFIEDPMPTLERIPKLHRLGLSYNAFLGKEMVCSATGFPQLQLLDIDGLSELEKWRVDDGAMPNLSTIHIECCNKLGMLPDGFRFLTALQELKIVDMPEEFRDRVRSGEVKDEGIGHAFYKVRHVPCIKFSRY